MKKKLTYVSRPYLPPLERFMPMLESIWESRQLTNNGYYNTCFSRKLQEVWGVEHVVTFANGTQALIAALSCLTENIVNEGDKGEVITTPFTFIATTNAIIWSRNNPVFVDIDASSLNIDTKAVEAAITNKTEAILAVHCYGNPCDLLGLKSVANKYDIPLIYDAAHAFGVEVGKRSIMSYGDMSVMSFHATKVLNTFEGGAVACHSSSTRDQLLNFSNFGFKNETTISSLGLNAKMSEFNAALGLLQLDYVEDILSSREEVAKFYKRELSGLSSVFIPQDSLSTRANYAYFPIFIEPNGKAARDETYLYLREHGYMVRRYFYPLTCDFAIPEVETKGIKHNIVNAKKRSAEVLCLPIYPELGKQELHEIVRLLREKLA